MIIDITNKKLINIVSIISENIINIDAYDIIEFKTDITDMKSWVDLAQSFYCKMLIPEIIDENIIIVKFKKLNTENSFHKSTEISSEKYGVDSSFYEIEKNEKPAFLMHYLKALENVNIEKRVRILNLGISKGSEFEVIQKYSKNFKHQKLVGIDYCKSAIEDAKKRFDCDNIEFIQCDINKLDSLNLDQFDLIITIGTLQSTSIDLNATVMSLVQNNLKKDGAMIMGFPNCRWCDGEMIYGANVKNYNFSEMSVLYKDVIFCKKYFQQKKFRVTITGKDYIFLTATSIRK